MPNISPKLIKKVLQEYDEKISLLKRNGLFSHFLIIEYEGNNYYEIEYLKDVFIGYYILTPNGLYFGQSKRIHLKPENLITQDDKILSGIKLKLKKKNHLCINKKNIEGITGHCIDEDKIISKLKLFYFSLENSDQRDQLNIDELYEFYKIIWSESRHYLPDQAKISVGYLINTVIARNIYISQELEILHLLFNNNAYNKKLFTYIIDVEYDYSLFSVIKYLEMHHILNKENIDTIYSHEQSDIEKIINTLRKCSSFPINQDIFNFIINRYKHIKDVWLETIKILVRNNIVDNRNMDTIFNNENNIDKITKLLRQCNFDINQNMFDFIVNYFEHINELILSFLRESINTDPTKEFSSKLSSTDFIFILNFLITIQDNPLIKHYTNLTSIDIYDGGRSSDNWWKLTYQLLKYLPAPSHRPSHSFFNSLTQVATPNQEIILTKFIPALKSDWSFLRLQGRTILLKNEYDEILSIKINKKNENIDELSKEYKASFVLKNNAHKYGLIGKFVDPIGVINLSGTFIRSLIKLNHDNFLNSSFYLLTDLKSDQTYTAYLYKISSDQHGYHIYLHDTQIPHVKFVDSNQIMVTNLSKLLANGVVFDRLGDIFHNVVEGFQPNTKRHDLGRYIILANLLASLRHRRSGSGRLTAWHKAIEYPNLRLEHLADAGDCIPLSDLSLDGEWCKRYFPFLRREYGNKVIHYLIANTLAEYLYILMLIAGKRAYALTKNMDKLTSINIWETMANQVFENSITMICTLTYKSKSEIRTTLSKICNISRLTRQMQFWMTEEYIEHVKNNKIPEDIYGNDVNVYVDITQFRPDTFNDEIGCSINGKDPDLGAVNGQEPIKEANKLFYWTISLILAAYIEFNATLQDTKTILRESDFDKRESTRENLFSYLPAPSRNKVQASICKTLAKNASNPDQAKFYQQASEQHMQLHHVSSIQNFWRKKLDERRQNDQASNSKKFTR